MTYSPHNMLCMTSGLTAIAMTISLTAPAMALDAGLEAKADGAELSAEIAENAQEMSATEGENQNNAQPEEEVEGEEANPLQEIAQLLALGTSVFAGDFVTVGAGVGLVPSYEGSDSNVLFPGPQLVGQVDGFQFAAVGPGLAVDLVRESPLDRVNIIAGPLVRANLNRVIASQINDEAVEALGDLDPAIEIGGRFGVAVNGILTRFDTLSFVTNVAFDVNGAHSGAIVTPSINYRRPIGNAALVRVSISADWVDDDFAQYYYGIDAAGAIASGLPVFDAEGGVKAVSTNILGTYDLSGNALDGGWGIFSVLGYTRLRESAAATPITSIRGDADQFLGALGISYTF